MFLHGLLTTSLAKPEGKTTLPLVLLRCLIRPFTDAILPRLFLITFRYCQAILIHVAINFVTSHDPDDETMDTGYWLVLFAIIVYTGMAVSMPPHDSIVRLYDC